MKKLQVKPKEERKDPQVHPKLMSPIEGSQTISFSIMNKVLLKDIEKILNKENVN